LTNVETPPQHPDQSNTTTLRHLPPLQASATLYSGNYIERFGADCPAIVMREHLGCSSCRGRMANLHESAR
jgi:hypothetical protein